MIIIREILFRAWAEHTENECFKYAWNSCVEEFDKIEPSRYSDEWDTWYRNRSDRYNELIIKWNENHIEDERYTKVRHMITDIKVNGTIQRPHNYEILDVMQYTGLVDKNGVKVFEGDIINAQFHNGLYEDELTETVIFENGEFGIKHGDLYKSFYPLSHFYKPLEYEYISNYGEVATKTEPIYVVIGNIYEEK